MFCVFFGGRHLNNLASYSSRAWLLGKLGMNLFSVSFDMYAAL